MEQPPGSTLGAAAPGLGGTTPRPGGTTASQTGAGENGQAALGPGASLGAITYLRRAGFTYQYRVGPYQLFRLGPYADGWGRAR